MKHLFLQNRNMAFFVIIAMLLALFVYVALRSGPLAPVEVTVTTVQSRPVRPGLFGIGTVNARYTYKIGPIIPGRLKRLDVHVGDHVKEGQVLGEMDPVDLDSRIHAQEAALKRAKAVLREAEARQAYAQTQARRYDQLLEARSTSKEIVAAKHQELQIADAALFAAREDLIRSRFDRDALVAQRENLRLVAPADGLVAVRDADPGTTLVAGQAVVEIIDPKTLWINTRFDQIHAAGLRAGLPARIVLRSRSGRIFTGKVLRVEPLADAVTEETLAKVVFDTLPNPLPPLGELAEITVSLPMLAARPVIPNAAIRRVGGKTGVWRTRDGKLLFTPIEPGASDLDGQVQVRKGLREGDTIVVYSKKILGSQSRIHVVNSIQGAEL